MLQKLIEKLPEEKIWWFIKPHKELTLQVVYTVLSNFALVGLLLVFAVYQITTPSMQQLSWKNPSLWAFYSIGGFALSLLSCTSIQFFLTILFRRRGLLAEISAILSLLATGWMGFGLVQYYFYMG